TLEQFIDQAMPYGTPSTNIVLSEYVRKPLLFNNFEE
ncbi:AsnC family transcriptional regulator, partial [Butyricicoccus sp. 1XD8-22]